MQRDTSTLVITDGGLGALVATMIEAERGEVVLWLPADGGALTPAGWSRDAAGAALTAQVESLGLERVVPGPAVGPGMAGAGWGLRAVSELVGAVAAAGELGVRRVVWPVACGEDVDQLLSVTEAAGLAERAGAIGSPEGRQVLVETPMADLGERQLAELLSELGGREAWVWRPARAAVFEPGW